MGATLENHNQINYTYIGLSDYRSNQSLSEKMSFHNTSNSEYEKSYVIEKAIFFSIGVICFLGLVGNGIVIWLLGFRIKRTPFSIYILNLAVADFGLLASASMITASRWFKFYYVLNPSLFLFLLMYSASQFLLTAISVDRCVAVFFPLWHRCRKPPRLSTFVCALIWSLSFLLTAITCTLVFFHFSIHIDEDYYQFLVNGLLCLPVITIATVSLFIKICLKARLRRRGKLLTIVLLTLLFFLLFAFPLDVICILYIFYPFLIYISYVFEIALLLACLNSSINPTIYILVGREWKSRRKETLKMIFQKVFKGEEGCAEESPVESQL